MEGNNFNLPQTSGQDNEFDRINYQANMEKRLGDLGAKIDEFTATAKEKYHVLREKQAAASSKFHTMKESSGEAWHEFKTGMDKAFEELSKAWEEIKTGSSRAASKFDK